MAGRPSDSIKLLKMKGKTHVTKAEEEKRKAAEAATLTGKPMRAWKTLSDNARKEFDRIRELFKLIDKDDAIYSNVINRYAQLKVECDEMVEMVDEFRQSKHELQAEYRDGGIDHEEFKPSRYYKLLTEIQKNIISLERQKQAKREMMLRIEKENIMTVASALRSVPKKQEKKDKSTGMSKFTNMHALQK